MAIYHLSVKCMSRSKGQSATAAAAYRSAERIRDERTGEIHDYGRKGGVLHRELVLPQDSPAWARQRQRLWNAAEVAETRKNSTVAREFEIALPSELKASERARLAVDFARSIAAKHRCAVDVSVHRPGRGGDTRNHHAHLLCSTRRLGPKGFTEKTRELDDFKTGEVVYWRERWAALTNERLKARGSPERIDHRTLEAQGIDRAPTVHKGPLLTAIERRGLRADVAERLERERREVEKSILVLSTDIAAARAERDRAGTGRTDAKTRTPAQGRESPNRSALDQWRDEVRRAREEAKERSKESERTRDSTKDKDRDGPDYER